MHRESARIGVISDTHNDLDPGVGVAFDGVDRILHAGDIGGPEVLSALQKIAPVIAVRGNTDPAVVTMPLDEFVTVRIGGHMVAMIHDSYDLPRHSLPPDTELLVSGHTHIPWIGARNGVTHVIPGSPTKPRSGAPPSVAVVELGPGSPEPHIVTL